MLKLDKHTKLFALLVFMIPVSAFAVINWLENQYQQLPIYGESKIVNGKEIEFTIPAFEFTNQNGEKVNESSWDNKIIVADFFFTHCPSVCPTMTKSLKRVQTKFSGNKKIAFTSFTVDPERDNPEKLKSYAQKFNLDEENWNLLTGDKKDLYRFARKGLFLVATDGDGGENDFIHSEKLVLIDSKKRIRGYYDGTDDEKVNQLITDIKKLNK